MFFKVRQIERKNEREMQKTVGKRERETVREREIIIMIVSSSITRKKTPSLRNSDIMKLRNYGNLAK